MEVVQCLHMNKGEGETSFAKNSTVQREIILHETSIMKEAISDCMRNTSPRTMGIADLGCSSGPNSLMVISEIINTIYSTNYYKMGYINSVPEELVIGLNDLPCNDFNDLFMYLPEFYKKLEKDKGIGLDGCFVSGVAGSFYGRLFPKKSLHFVHSSSSLHWLSEVPESLDKNKDELLNKGKIYISKTSPDCVAKAYLSQFHNDFLAFLGSRAVEIVSGGGMLLSFMGRISPEAAAEVGSHQWELLAQALISMASEGLIEEEKIDSFNAPYYAPSVEEVRNVIEEEGSFIIKHLEAFEIGWDEGYSSDSDTNITTRGQHVAKTIRAVVESMLESHFGTLIMDHLFYRYGQLIDDYFFKTKTRPIHINLVISVTRK